MTQHHEKASRSRLGPRRARRRPKNDRIAVERARQLAEALLQSLKPAGAATVRRENPDDDDEDPTRRAGGQPH
jgi:hypothetical protein